MQDGHETLFARDVFKDFLQTSCEKFRDTKKRTRSKERNNK